MAITSSARSRSGGDWPIFAIAAAMLIAMLLWGAGALSALLSGHVVPRRRPFGGFAAVAHFGDPSLGWGAPVGPWELYWTVTGVVVAVVATTGLVGWRRWHGEGKKSDDPARVEGLADRRQVTAIAGTKALLARAPTLRPSLARPTPAEVGYFLGRSRGVECWASVEDSIVVVGPPRSGKGFNLVIPAILDAPGAVITTSTRPDNLAATLTARSKVGPVAVFDPQDLAPGVSSSLRWSPIRGCEQPQVAMIRAWALCADAGQGTESGSFWRQQTITAVRCLLHAAALGARSPADLYRWSLTPAAAKEAVDLLVDTPGAALSWDRALDAILAADPRQRDSVWAMVANAFASLADPHVLQAVSPDLQQCFDPVSFMRDEGTLYLLGTASGASATASLVAALVEDVVEVARRVAACSPGARLDPPLGLILDEAANYPLPSLGALMSEGGGTGITTMTVLQSLAQARDRWGRETAGAIWDSGVVKLVLPGSSNADDLADISRLLGDRTVVEHTESFQPGGARSVSSANRERPILDPATIRTLRPGHALLLLRSAKPIMLSPRPWTERPDAEQIRDARAQIEARFRAVASQGLEREQPRECAGTDPAVVSSESSPPTDLCVLVRLGKERDVSDSDDRARTADAPTPRLSALDALFGVDGPPDFDEPGGPFHWADLTAGEARAAWPELRAWVEDLVARFAHLDHHVIPACWWRHNSHVEALAALRDHERISYAATAPATAAIEWHRALRDIEAMLREWTGEQGCGAIHNDRDRRLRPPAPEHWDQFVRADFERRERDAVDAALNSEEPAP